MRHRAKLSRKMFVACAAVVLFLLGGISTASARTDACITADVPEAFVLPGGDEYEPGKLTLCRDRQFSPSRALLVGYVDRASVGMLFAEPRADEPSTGTDPFLLFVRDGEGKLHLRGYSVASRDGMESFAVNGLERERVRVLTHTGPSAQGLAVERPILFAAARLTD